MNLSGRSLPRDVARLAAACLLAGLLGVGPLGLLQAVAWAGMIVDYSSRYGITGGISRTFDGQHPCPMCKKITKARQDQRTADSTVTLPPTKLVCLVAPAAQLPSARLHPRSQDYFGSPRALRPRSERPPIPPPRSRAA